MSQYFGEKLLLSTHNYHAYPLSTYQMRSFYFNKTQIHSFKINLCHHRLQYDVGEADDKSLEQQMKARVTVFREAPAPPDGIYFRCHRHHTCVLYSFIVSTTAHILLLSSFVFVIFPLRFFLLLKIKNKIKNKKKFRHERHAKSGVGCVRFA
jgi:hypothetical protein